MTVKRYQFKRDSAKTLEESFTITTKTMTHRDLKDSRQWLSAKDSDRLVNLLEVFQINPESITSEEDEFFQSLQKLRLKYPRNPVILNYLAVGYKHLNQHDKAKDLIFETSEKFPYYTLGIAAKALILLCEGFPNEAFEVVGKALSLKQLYPNRITFHSTELLAFENFLVAYFCHTKDLKQARDHLELMKTVAFELLEDPRNPVFIEAKALVKSHTGIRGLLKRLVEKSKKDI